jgi:pimeloyl-ACP methyl ester carboxylesterase
MAVVMVASNRRAPRREGIGQLINTAYPTVIGGTTASKITFEGSGGRSTDVVKLTGDSDQTIVFIHNTPFNQEVWYSVYMIAQRYKNEGKKIPTMYCYDLLGHNTGWVSVPKRFNDENMNNYAWSFDEFTSDLYQIYNKFIKTGKVTLVGYGVGGAIAQVFSLRYPQLIRDLYILCSPVGPTELGVSNETAYLVQWLAKNPLVTYVTMEESFVRANMCLWFEDTSKLRCPGRENEADTRDMSDTVEYLLAEKMYRTGSSATYLQMDKLVASTDIREMWRGTKSVPFPVTFLIADRDHYTDTASVQRDIELVKSADTKLVIVEGKHGFPLTHPEYIYRLITKVD